MKLWDLERAAEILAVDDPRISPAGPMVRYLGPQLSQREVADAYASRTDGLDELSSITLRSIRAFPVARLANVQVTCEPDQFCDEIRSVLSARLPGTTWPEWHFQGLGREGLIEKYHLLDGAYTAPVDAATKQPMVIELGGEVSGSDAPLNDGDPFPERITISITHAHWANVAGLGVGVGFYL